MLTDGRQARAGLACLIQPTTGDRVLITQDHHPDVCQVLAILERAESDSATRVTLKTPNPLLFQAPEINIKSSKLYIYSQEFLSNTSRRHIVEDSRTVTAKLRVAEIKIDKRKARTIEDVVSGALFQRFRLWLSNTTHEARLKAQSFIYDKYSK